MIGCGVSPHPSNRGRPSTDGEEQRRPLILRPRATEIQMVRRVNTDPNPTTADTLTLDRARRGDNDSLADLWSIYQPQLLRLLRAQGRAGAEDITSQVWIDVSRNLDRFQGDGVAFRNWIFTIAGRRAIDEARRIGRRAEIVSSSLAPLLANRGAVDPRDDSLDGVLALLTTLQPAAAEVVMLRVVHELPVAEVARLTGRTETNVRVISHRALEHLRNTLEKGGAIAVALSPEFGIT